MLGRIRGLARTLGGVGAALSIGVALVATAGTAAAHPLGNFTVNRYARVEISTQTVRVYYVLDEAEIPAFVERDAVRRDPTGFATRRAADILNHLQFVAAGETVVLHTAVHDLSQPAGQGGLTTLRLAIRFEGTIPKSTSGSLLHAVVSDTNEPDRIGWRELVVTSRGDAHITASSAPSQDLSDELRHYPADLIQAPLDLRTATFDFVPGSVIMPPLPIASTPAAPNRYGGQFTALIQRHTLTPLVLAGMLGLALIFGAGHALAPGHGKTIMAAYLVGSKGRPRDAVLLGAIVSVMHTASVLVLGAVLFQVSRSAAPDQVYPWLKLGSGIAVVLFGASLVHARLRALHTRPPSPTKHATLDALDPHPAPALVSVGSPASHDHGHHVHRRGHRDHDHDHGPAGHSHELAEGVAPLSRRGLIVLATTGGLFPSPSALIVLLAAFELNRIGLGLTLIAAFSLGLAVTLTGVGLALVYGRRIVEGRGVIPVLRFLPVASAAAICLLGLFFAWSGARGVH
jgi:ABC-type nickel/cobalt efflux system permease component RcnA